MLIEDDRQIWYAEAGLRRGLIPVTEQTRKRKLAANARKAVNGKGAEASNKKQKGKAGAVVSRASQILADLDEDILGNGHANGTSSHNRDSYAVDPNLFLRVNFDRFDVHIRDEMIVHAVASRYNAPLASVMQSILQLQKGGYDRIPQAREAHSDMIQTDLLHSQLPMDLSFRGIFDVDTIKQKLGSSKNVTQASLLREALSVLLGDGDDSSVGASKRFMGPYAGTEARMTDGAVAYGKIQIEYANAGRAMRQQILSNVVDAQFGPSAVRVVSLLVRMGKLDEKQISKVCLLSISETRDVCARLFAAGVLSLQEVPKASERTATRSYFFWYVDPSKCLAWLSDRLCKTLARLAQRRRHELAREANLLDKASRLDVGKAGRSDHVGLRDVERLRLKHVRETVDTFILAETRTMRDLFVVANLPE
jgi:DNA-directed RNA polymerase III subunit RPC3